MSFFGRLLLVAALLSGPSFGTVIINTFGPGDAYDLGVGYTLGNSLESPFTQGNQFTPASTAILGLLQLAVGRISGSNELDVWLTADDAGAPGTVIESFHFSNAMGPLGQLNPLLSAYSVVQPVLSAGTPYWLIATTTDPTAWAAWNQNSIGATGPRAVRQGAGTWDVFESTRAAFRLTTDTEGAVPEPGTLGLLLAGLAVLTRIRALRRS